MEYIKVIKSSFINLEYIKVIKFTLKNNYYATTYTLTEYNPTVMRSILKLEAGSRVDVWLKEGDIHDHNVENKGPHTHFVGWLLERGLEKA